MKTLWAVVIAVFLVGCGSDERMPFNAGKKFVLDGLKSPSTAKFPSAYDEKVGWKDLGSQTYAVWGYVDSQNAFGAMIRNDWQAVVQKRGDDWYRLYLKLGDREVGDASLFKR